MTVALEKAGATVQQEYYVRCPFGLEKTTASELSGMGIKKSRPLKGGVAFFGTLEQAYRACLWLRSASRVLLVLSRFSATDASALYEGARAFNWLLHMTPHTTFAIHARGVNTQLKNTQYIAQKVKDALCDSLVEQCGKRPDVQQKRPDVQFEVALRQDKATLYIDLSGEPLHRRGYRTQGEQGKAPIKENLAAGVLLNSGWGSRSTIKESSSSNDLLCDPLCGSGTFVIEGAMIAADMAPGLLRDYWGFLGWRGHQEEAWIKLLNEAQKRLEIGRVRMPYLIGSDTDKGVIALALQSARRAGLSDCIYFGDAGVADVQDTVQTAVGVLADRQERKAEQTQRQGREVEQKQRQGREVESVQHQARGDETVRQEGSRSETMVLPSQGMVITNPPYAERLMNESELPLLYEQIRRGLSGLPSSWSVHIITSDPSIDIHLGMTPYASEILYNGKIETALRHYRPGDANAYSVEVTRSQDGTTVTIPTAEKGSEQFAARFKKVAKERKKWAKREGITCYRIYDADLPDYAVAIDRYEGKPGDEKESGASGEVYTCITEYRAPKEIDPLKAQRRLQDVLAIAPAVMGIDNNKVIAKVRKRAKGGGQYQDKGEAAHTKMIVKEGGHSLEVDVSGYLDTGLFLDHRITRGLVEVKAQGKDFLNLFAYTGTATVYAAAGGARSTTSVDLSNTYCSWAERNMKLNGFTDNRYKTVRADVLDWLKQARTQGDTYDLIFVDPPTFSNSKMMGEVSWSVQRDHVELLKAVTALLRPGGEILFSCNLRTFKLDYSRLLAAGIGAEDITQETIPEDFARNKKIHVCYVVTSVV